MTSDDNDGFMWQSGDEELRFTAGGTSKLRPVVPWIVWLLAAMIIALTAYLWIAHPPTPTFEQDSNINTGVAQVPGSDTYQCVHDGEVVGDAPSLQTSPFDVGVVIYDQPDGIWMRDADGKTTLICCRYPEVDDAE